MVFDLRGALLKKEEVESARLMDFEFRLRARTMRLLAGKLAVEEAELLGQVALHGDEGILAELRPAYPGVDAMFHEAQVEARRQLIAERGDPTPHKLA